MQAWTVCFLGSAEAPGESAGRCGRLEKALAGRRGLVMGKSGTAIGMSSGPRKSRPILVTHR